jgi:hypothetical protein
VYGLTLETSLDEATPKIGVEPQVEYGAAIWSDDQVERDRRVTSLVRGEVTVEQAAGMPRLNASQVARWLPRIGLGSRSPGSDDRRREVASR